MPVANVVVGREPDLKFAGLVLDDDVTAWLGDSATS
jgi:hypothetical protein